MALRRVLYMYGVAQLGNLIPKPQLGHVPLIYMTKNVVTKIDASSCPGTDEDDSRDSSLESLSSAEIRQRSDTVVVNLRKEKYDIYIGRGSPFGNPFPIDSKTFRSEVITKYRVYFKRKIASDPSFKKEVLSLRGKRLGCYCKPKACHGDIIADYLNNPRDTSLDPSLNSDSGMSATPKIGQSLLDKWVL